MAWKVYRVRYLLILLILGCKDREQCVDDLIKNLNYYSDKYRIVCHYDSECYFANFQKEVEECQK